MTIYMDNAATTKISKNVLDEMINILEFEYGNPSSIYSMAQSSKEKIENSRRKIAQSLNAKPKEIFFTSCGSESDNWAIKGIANSYKKKGKHIITTKIEHHAVLHTTEFLESIGYSITYLDVDRNGFIDLKELENSIKDDTILISIMFANNEVGTIEPIKEIGEIAKKHNVIFHVDAVQALGNVKIDLSDLNVDLMSFSGHKIHGPKGVGVLYIKEGTKITPLIHGGAQEREKRAGTENTAYIVAMGTATVDIIENLEENSLYTINLRDKLIEELLKIDGIHLNGPRENRLPGNVNVSIDGVKASELLMFLDMKGICASSASACTSGSLEPSHVLLAMGRNEELSRNCLRLTLNNENTMKEVIEVSTEIKNIVEHLRKK